MKTRPKIAIERFFRGMRQADLARAAGLSQSYLANIEVGRRTPSPKAADAIARALGVQVDSIFTREPDR
jgi:transcriptional regulator with XRE-family HTH domain